MYPIFIHSHIKCNTLFVNEVAMAEMQLTVGPVGPRPVGGRILEGPANDVFVSDLMSGKHFYCLGLSNIKFLSVLLTS